MIKFKRKKTNEKEWVKKHKDKRIFAILLKDWKWVNDCTHLEKEHNQHTAKQERQWETSNIVPDTATDAFWIHCVLTSAGRWQSVTSISSCGLTVEWYRSKSMQLSWQVFSTCWLYKVIFSIRNLIKKKMHVNHIKTKDQNNSNVYVIA